MSSDGSRPELVTITVDDVEIQVPKGTGLVEAALMAGIEIPAAAIFVGIDAPDAPGSDDAEA